MKKIDPIILFYDFFMIACATAISIYVFDTPSHETVIAITAFQALLAANRTKETKE